jgi:hypothetical protein
LPALSGCLSHFFADDLAAIVAGQMGIKFTEQCLDLQRRIKGFVEDLEYYSCLTDQPINTKKTEALFSARAVNKKLFDIFLNQGSTVKINWVSEYKYLGYIVSSKFGWVN